MVELEKTDHILRLFVGTDYNFSSATIKTVGDIKAALNKIIEDLPDDDSEKVGDFYLHDGKLSYTLENAIDTGEDHEARVGKF